MADYTALDRHLHRLVLGSSLVGELSFDLEKRLFRAVANHHDSIYVTGLARAGTTALMRGLYTSGQFASLTYDDMPFVLAPNLWGKLSKPHTKQRSLQERAHGDGIYVDFDSPEALEEVFWRLHCGTEYIYKDSLRTHAVNSEVISKLVRYQSLICHKYEKDRYLAKNNNHILRIPSFARQANNTMFLILFREPVSQAHSLLQQHLKFLDADSFTCEYMTWLVHHEFGATHLPFRFFDHVKVKGSPKDLDYWLDRWLDAYAYMLELMEKNLPNVIAVSYERLCNQEGYWNALCNKIGLPVSTSSFRNTTIAAEPNVDANQLLRAKEIYQKLDYFAQKFPA